MNRPPTVKLRQILSARIGEGRDKMTAESCALVEQAKEMSKLRARTRTRIGAFLLK
jgi:hypothetical protein